MTARAHLTVISPIQKRRYARGMDAVEERLGAVAAGLPGVLGEASAHTLQAGGKRVRPLLTLLCARNDAPLAPAVIAAAAAVELLHAATLVHDDVLDAAELRRGRATVASEYGVETAFSAGNALLARSFSLLAETGDAAAVAALSAASLRLAHGEVLQRDQTRNVALSQDEYTRRCELKTADLFAVACGLGARLSGASEAAAAALTEYGRLLGLAFQVLDDVLDCSGEAATTGKQPGVDVRDGTVTLPLFFAIEAEPSLAAILARHDLGADDVAAVLRTVAACGALERARGVAMRYIETAGGVLDACPGPVERTLLPQVAAQVVARYS